MAEIQGFSRQFRLNHEFDASGTITTGGTAQIVLPQRPSCSYIFVQNISAGNLFIEVGPARVTAQINTTTGKVTGFTVTNGGLGYMAANPPNVRVIGGGWGENTANVGLGIVGGESPKHPATAIATVTGSAVTAVTLTNDGGSHYVTPPYVYLDSNLRNLYCAATPSATNGIMLLPGGTWIEECSTVTTDAISIWGATTGQAFTCKWKT